MEKVVRFALFILMVGLTSVYPKVYSECALAKALLVYGMPKEQIPNWICLVESESNGYTGAKGGPNSDGSYDYGIYQINNRYWCKEGYAGGDCHIKCKNLLNDNIADDTKCAQLIYKQSGFSAWNGWKEKCQGVLPNISKCRL